MPLSVLFPCRVLALAADGTAVPGRGAGSAAGAVTPLPPSREALKPFCRKAGGERKQEGKEREGEINNKQKLAASVLSSAVGAGAWLWCRLRDRFPQGCAQQRGQGRKRGQTVPGAQECLDRSELAGIPSSNTELHPTGSFQLLLCQHLPCRSTPARLWGTPGRLALHHLASADLFNGAAKGTKPFTTSALLE